MEEPVRLKFRAPDSKTPGFLRRMAKAMEFAEAIEAKQLTSKLVYDMADFLADFIADTPRAEARALLLEASEEQFTDMLSAVTGSRKDGEPPLPVSEKNG